jgi:hypothetical protein
VGIAPVSVSDRWRFLARTNLMKLNMIRRIFMADCKTNVLLSFIDAQSIETQYREAQKNIAAMREHLHSDMVTIEKLYKRSEFFKLLLYLSIIIGVIGWAGFVLK